MSSPGLIDFWNENEKRIGEALPRGIDALALALAPGADSLDLNQQVEGETVILPAVRNQLRVRCRY